MPHLVPLKGDHVRADAPQIDEPPAGRFAVFLSHNSREKPTVERIAEKLKRAELEPWLDKWCLTPAGDWQDELAQGLRASSACAVFVGPHGIGELGRPGVQAGR